MGSRVCVFSNLTYAQTEKDSLNSQPQLSLPNPVRYEAFYDVKEGVYFLYPKIGNVVTGTPIVMTPSEYGAYVKSIGLRNYYQEKSLQYDLANNLKSQKMQRKKTSS